MALPRWKRRRDGEGPSTEEIVEQRLDDLADGAYDPMTGELPARPAVETVVEPDVEPVVEPVVADTDEDDRPIELPHVPDRSGLNGWLFGGREPGDLVPIQLLQAAHAKQAITTALAVALVAMVAGRQAKEVGVILLTVLVGQTILGWHNDIVDRLRDQAHGLQHKPLAMGRLDPGSLWYAIVVATLILVPLAITTGIRAGCIYLAAVAVGMLGNVLLRTGFFSWWSWAASYALIPAYLSYGGWGGQAVGHPPETVIVVLAGLLGIGVHFMRAVWGLVADHQDNWTYLPLKLGLKLGATRLLALSTIYSAIVAIALVIAGAKVGLTR